MKKAAAFLCAFLLIASLASGYTLPVPPNTVKEDEIEANINNIPYTTQVYLSELPLGEVVSFYKENLPKQGFSLSGENENTQALVFSHPVLKDNLAIVVENTPENKILIRISNWHGELVKEEAAKPDFTKDVPGSDVPGVPRYPSAVRISSVSYGEMKNASYTSQDEKEKILSFYKAQMPAYGWKNPGVEAQAKQKIGEMFGEDSGIAQSGLLFFENKNMLCNIVVAEACCGKQGSTIGVSVFTIQKLQELQSNGQDEDEEE